LEAFCIEWRVGRVVYGAGLENPWEQSLTGSNPVPSARIFKFADGQVLIKKNIFNFPYSSLALFAIKLFQWSIKYKKNRSGLDLL
jgi:hypothetical protein